jgi:Flp pilus assembly protein TadG
MSGFFAFLRDKRAAAAAEFALIIPVLLIAIIGTIDVGRYAWALAMSEKATQVGARFAVATDMIVDNFETYSFATNGSPLVPAGTSVPAAQFPGVTCNSAGCTCLGTCSFPTAADTAAFNLLVDRMRQINPDITAANVVVTYAWSGLGFAGDPNGPDVAPLTTVSLRNMQFAPATLLVLRTNINMPQFAYTLPMEDGSGTTSN